MNKKNNRKSNRIREIFSANLICLRKSSDMSPLALAKKSGLTYNFINDIENGKKGVSLETLDKLSTALEVDPYLFFLNPAQYLNSEKQQMIGIIETLNKNINRIFDYSIKELAGNRQKKQIKHRTPRR